MAGGGDDRGRGRHASPRSGRGRRESPPSGRGSGSPSRGRGFASPSARGGGSATDPGNPSRHEYRELEDQFSPPPIYQFDLKVEPKQVPPKMRSDDVADADVAKKYYPIRQTASASPEVSQADIFPTLEESLGRSHIGSQSPSTAGLAGSSSKQSLSTDPFMQKFMNLLNSSVRYKATAEVNAKMGLKTLDVNFEDLLTEEYIDLAIEITKKAIADPWHSWLQSVARDFLNVEFKCTDKEKRDLGFRFLGQPKSIKRLAEFETEDVVMKQPVHDQKYFIVRTTKTGRLVYLSVINHVLAVHKKRQGWKGEFEEKHIYILEYKGMGRFRCVILASRADVYAGDYNAKILDLQKVYVTLTPRYALDGEFPAFFSDLKVDLAGLTPSRMSGTNILKVLSFHYSLMPPEAWGFIVGKLHFVIHQFMASGTRFKILFGEKLSNDESDWRPTFRNSSDLVVKGVYDHDNSGGDKFSNTLLGMCDCNRHLVQHAHNHPKDNPVKVRAKDENELFAAFKMPKVLPSVICGLFRGKEMLYKKELGQIYEEYCKLCYDVDEDPFEDKE